MQQYHVLWGHHMRLCHGLDAIVLSYAMRQGPSYTAISCQGASYAAMLWVRGHHMRLWHGLGPSYAVV